MSQAHEQTRREEEEESPLDFEKNSEVLRRVLRVFNGQGAERRGTSEAQRFRSESGKWRRKMMKKSGRESMGIGCGKVELVAERAWKAQCVRVQN